MYGLNNTKSATLFVQVGNRAFDFFYASFTHEGVPQAGVNIIVSKQFLNEPDIRSIFDQVGRVGMSKAMDFDIFVDFSFSYGSFKYLLTASDTVMITMPAFK